MINGSDLINQPWNTTWSPFTQLLGSGFFLIPVAFIGAALFMKTRDPVLLSVYMIVSGALLTAGNLFMGTVSAVPIFVIFSALGIAVLLFNMFFGGK